MLQKPLNNRKIRAKIVLLVDEETKREVTTSIDQNLADNKKRDLVQVGFNECTKIPVCKIFDYGKFKYEQVKKRKQTKKVAAKQSHMKEMMFRLNCAEHDINIKKRKIKEFIDKGSVVKFGIELRGREKSFRRNAREMLKTHVNDFTEIAKYDNIQESDRFVFVLLNPI